MSLTVSSVNTISTFRIILFHFTAIIKDIILMKSLTYLGLMN